MLICYKLRRRLGALYFLCRPLGMLDIAIHCLLPSITNMIRFNTMRQLLPRIPRRKETFVFEGSGFGVNGTRYIYRGQSSMCESSLHTRIEVPVSLQHVSRQIPRGVPIQV